MVFELLQHFELAVGFKTRKNAGSMVVIKKFSAEFQVKLVAEHVNPLFDVFGLHFQIFLIIKSIFHEKPLLIFIFPCYAASAGVRHRKKAG